MLGIFDSGVGGLSVLKVLKEKAPLLDVVYFGDIKNAPYGIRTQEDLKRLTVEGVRILLENGATDILSACNSISAFMIIDDLKNLSTKTFNITEMINPTVERFSKDSTNKIAIFATPATIESKAYQNSFRKNNIEIKTFAIPELAGAIEFGAGDEEIEKIVKGAVSKSSLEDFETALLCCTHYPFVKDKFEKAFLKQNKKVIVYDPAEAVAEKTIKNYKQKGTGKIRFLISQDSPTFRKMVAEHFSNFDYSIEIVK